MCLQLHMLPSAIERLTGVLPAMQLLPGSCWRTDGTGRESPPSVQLTTGVKVCDHMSPHGRHCLKALFVHNPCALNHSIPCLSTSLPNKHFLHTTTTALTA
jgi:hypothetical protein